MDYTKGPWTELGITGRKLIIHNEYGSQSATYKDYRLMLAAPDMYEALKRVRQFITNGIEFGHIRMPDTETGDPALEVPGIIQAALAKAEGKEG